MAFLDIRLPFGSSSGPIQYRDVIEAIFDLTNDFLEDQSWDVAEFHANIEPRLDAPWFFSEKEEYGTALLLLFHIPLRETHADGYIDYLCTLAVHTGDNLRKAMNAGAIAI